MLQELVSHFNFTSKFLGTLSAKQRSECFTMNDFERTKSLGSQLGSWLLKPDQWGKREAKSPTCELAHYTHFFEQRNWTWKRQKIKVPLPPNCHPPNCCQGGENAPGRCHLGLGVTFHIILKYFMNFRIYFVLPKRYKIRNHLHEQNWPWPFFFLPWWEYTLVKNNIFQLSNDTQYHKS